NEQTRHTPHFRAQGQPRTPLPALFRSTWTSLSGTRHEICDDIRQSLSDRLNNDGPFRRSSRRRAMTNSRVRRRSAPIRASTTRPCQSGKKPALEFTGGRGVDDVVEAGGGATLSRSFGAIRVGGKISMIGGLTGPATELNPGLILARRANVQGIFVGSMQMFE